MNQWTSSSFCFVFIILQKNLAKGRDLEEAILNIESAKELRLSLKENLIQYSDRLEVIRERIEGASRLHHLLGLDFEKKDDIQLEMQKLAEKIGAVNFIDRLRNAANKSIATTTTTIASAAVAATETKNNLTEHCLYWHSEINHCDNNRQSNNLNKRTGIQEMNIDDDGNHSKMGDSGLGSCDRCEIDNKLIRTCSCQSFDESTTNKSHNSDDIEEDCFAINAKGMMEYQMSPLKPNAHLYSYSSNIALPDMKDSSDLAPKTQKY